MLQPETDLEAFLLRQPEIQAGLSWGKPRFGHPEGEVAKHVAEVLENIDKIAPSPDLFRHDLRLVAFSHDAFKYAEDKREPRNWSLHHGVLARQFLERFTNSERVLEMVEWHDEAYYCWRMHAIARRPSRARQRFDALLARFAGQVDFYYAFFICDTRTGDKNQAPVNWFEREAEVQPLGWDA